MSGKDAESDGSQLTLEELSLQCPHLLSEVLSGLRVEKSHDVPHFVADLAELLDNQITCYQWDQFISTGLFSTIQELASDSRTYNPPKGQPEPEDGSDSAGAMGWYILSIFRCLSHFCGYLILTEEEGTNTYSEPARTFLEQIPHIWTSLLFSDDNAPNTNFLDWNGENSELGRVVMTTVLAQIRIHQSHHNEEVLPLDNVANHVLLRCWSSTNSLKVRCTSMLWFFTNIDAADLCCRETFILEHVKKPLNAERMIDALIIMFEDPDVQGEELMPHIAFFTQIINYYSRSDSLQNEVEGSLEDLIVSSCTAVRRMLCSGPEHMHRPALDILFVNFAVLFHYTTKRKEATTWQLLNAAPVVALWCHSVISPAINSNTSIVGKATELFLTYARIVSEVDQSSESFKQLQYLARTHWQPCVRELRLLKLRSRNQTHSDTYAKWVTIGEILGLNKTADPDEFPFEDENPWLVWKPCHWSDCLCSKVQSGHPMRVCKGCWKVLYCSKRCQIKDWKKGGHRAICRGRKAKSQ